MNFPKLNRFVFFLAFLFLAGIGCVSKTVQTDALLADPQSFPPSKEISGIPFIQQTTAHCGPATLAMVMNWAGKMVTVNELTPQIFTPGMQGSFQIDMISASRRNGMVAIPISGLNSLLTEIAADHPVIVFENLALTWAPRWHYAVVFGYDLGHQTVLMHSGPEAFKHWDLRKFERSWMLGDYWGLVVLPPGKLAASADEMSHIRAVAAMEQIGKRTEAEISYHAILQKWPQSLAASIGLANIAFAKQDAVNAENILLKASTQHPDSAMLWFNLSVAQRALKKQPQSKESLDRAFRLASPEEKSLFQKNSAP